MTIISFNILSHVIVMGTIGKSTYRQLLEALSIKLFNDYSNLLTYQIFVESGA